MARHRLIRRFVTLVAAGVLIGAVMSGASKPAPLSAQLTSVNMNAVAAAHAAYDAGWRWGAGLGNIVAVAGAESSWNPRAFNGSCCYGEWQIYGGNTNCYDWSNVYYNAKCARHLWNTQGGWCPWNGDGLVSGCSFVGGGRYLGACGGVCTTIAYAAVKYAGLT